MTTNNDKSVDLSTSATLSSPLPKEVIVGWISSMVEAYNMAIYSFIAPLLAPFLFQNTSPGISLIYSYFLVFVAFLVFYPAGALYYGKIGDRYGRQRICISSTLGLALATGLMGLIPIQVLDHAWIYFLVLICVQHFFSGGEYQGSIVFSLEHYSQPKNGWASACSCLFAVFGIAMANGLAMVAFHMQDAIWWQACFLLGGIGGIISYILKNYCQETPAFLTLSEQQLDHSGWLPFIKQEWRPIVRIFAVFAFFMVSYSFIFIFLPLLNLETNINALDTFKSLLAYGVLLIAAGLLADRFGISRIMRIGIGIFAISIVPLCYFIHDLFTLQLLLTMSACMTIAPIHSWMLEQFPPSRRCRGIFLSSALAIAVFGGSTVPICLTLFEASHSIIVCSLYPLIVAVMALLMAWGRKKGH